MPESKPVNGTRRRFLRNAVAGAAVATPAAALLTTANARSPAEPVSVEQRWGMLINAAKCAAGCDECVQACRDENGLGDVTSPATDAQWIRKVTLKSRRTGYVSSLPMLCQHCEHPPCVDVCPTGASFKRADGIVLVDKHICIGCRYCMMACPYKARSFIHEDLHDQLPRAPRGKGTVESCTLCVHRVDKDGASAKTACQQACDEAGHGAILFGDVNDPDSVVSKALKEQPSTELRSDLGLNLGVRYQGI